MYRSWVRHLRTDIELIGVEPPGRYERLREPGYRDAKALVRDLIDIMAPLLDQPFALFGHSMGALLAFELGCQLRERGLPSPRHLFLSARPAPHAPSSRTKLHQLDDDSLWEAACRKGGIPAGIQRDVGFQRMFLPLFRRDMELVETYDAAARAPGAIPITAIGGVDDDHPSTDELQEWAQYCSATFRTRTFPGGHFFLRSEEAPLVRFVDSVLTEGQRE